MQKFKWVVQFEVDRVWVEDGFNLTDDRARAMIADTLPNALADTEIKAFVIAAPPAAEIERAQGVQEDERERAREAGRAEVIAYVTEHFARGDRFNPFIEELKAQFPGERA